ncbi:MAG: hypothetical protein ABIO70_25430 [Pseudomonadota bacterium]
MNESKSESLFDVRTLERNLAAGRIEREQAQAFLDAIEDCEGEVAWTSTTMAMPANAAYVEPVPVDD